MIGSVLGIAVAMSTLGFWHDNTRLGRPIATAAPYPAAMADDVHRPGFNGRAWVGRPVIGGQQGPCATGCSPNAERYGAYGNENATVYVRVGGQVIGINAFEPITKNGLRRLEEARNFWLKENGYVGGVRTFVNDAYVKAPEAQARATDSAPPTRAQSAGKIEPRATIQLPADMPRRGNRLRVDAGSETIVNFPSGWSRVAHAPAQAPASVAAR